jgi:hypothetical protein
MVKAYDCMPEYGIKCDTWEMVGVSRQPALRRRFHPARTRLSVWIHASSVGTGIMRTDNIHWVHILGLLSLGVLGVASRHSHFLSFSVRV